MMADKKLEEELAKNNVIHYFPASFHQSPNLGTSPEVLFLHVFRQALGQLPAAWTQRFKVGNRIQPPPLGSSIYESDTIIKFALLANIGSENSKLFFLPNFRRLEILSN